MILHRCGFAKFPIAVQWKMSSNAWGTIKNYSTEKTSSQNIPKEIIVDEHREKFHCKDCDFSYTWKSGLEVHRRNFHSGPHKCNLCTYAFHNEESLIDHMRNLHDNFVSTNEEDSIISKGSNKRKVNVTEISTPKKFKIEYKCKVCNKKFRDNWNLRRHMNTHENV